MLARVVGLGQPLLIPWALIVVNVLAYSTGTGLLAYLLPLYGAFAGVAGSWLLWKIDDLGKGWSSPIIVGEWLYITGDRDKELVIYAFGQGAVIWVFISEIFPNRIRARGQALGSFTHWFMAAAISWTFPMFAEASGGHTFAFYAVMMVLQLIWVLRVMPETKGVPLEDIQKRLGIA